MVMTLIIFGKMGITDLISELNFFYVLYVKIFFKKERRDDVFVMDLSTKIWSKWHHKLLQRRAWHRTLVHGSSFIQVGGNTWLEKVCTEKNAGLFTVTTVDLCRS